MKAASHLGRVLGTASLCATLSVHAGRPLVVDDANVNDPGNGHVEAWSARQPGLAHTWTVAPAYSPAQGWELSGVLSRNTGNRTDTSALQGKLLLTPSQPRGCNTALVAGLSQTSGTPGPTPYLNGLLSCNRQAYAFHANLGALHASGGPTLASWGLAVERALGRVTAHAEWFGQQGSAPTFQLGLRGEIATRWQLDGTVGRSGRDTLYSLGFKRSF